MVSTNPRKPPRGLPLSNAFVLPLLVRSRMAHAFCHRRAGEERPNGRFAEDKATNELRMVHCQRERDVRAIRARHEMRGRRFQLGDQRSQICNVGAERIAVCLSWRSVGREETPAVDDDPEARRERLYLLAKRLEVTECAMNENERLALAAFVVVERCLIEVDRSDLGATRFRLTSCVREARADATSVSRICVRSEGASVIRIISTCLDDYGCLLPAQYVRRSVVRTR